MNDFSDLLSQANKQSSKTKKKKCPKGTNRRKKNCVKTQKKKKSYEIYTMAIWMTYRLI